MRWSWSHDSWIAPSPAGKISPARPPSWSPRGNTSMPNVDEIAPERHETRAAAESEPQQNPSRSLHIGETATEASEVWGETRANLTMANKVTVPLRSSAAHPQQSAFIQSPAKRKIIRAGRRSGKTTGSAV